eukprot:6726081-Karenia_brevis.AAC.1
MYLDHYILLHHKHHHHHHHHHGQEKKGTAGERLQMINYLQYLGIADEADAGAHREHNAEKIGWLMTELIREPSYHE